MLGYKLMIFLRILSISAFLMALSSGGASASDGDANLVPVCGGPFQLCGYVDKDNKAEIIPQRFEVAEPFHGGLAAVRIDGRYGYIHAGGEIIIDPQFEAAGPFRGGYAEVRMNGASGVIDRSGRLILPAKFSRIIPFKDGTFVAALVRNDRPAQPLPDDQLEGLSGATSLIGLEDAGLYDIQKGWLTEQDLEFTYFDTPERGLIWAGRGDGLEQTWGLLKSDGTWQVSPRYGYVQILSEDRAIVASMPDLSLPPQKRRASIRRGAVDPNGKLAVPLKFTSLSYWQEGYGLTQKEPGFPFNPDGTPRELHKAIVNRDGTLLANRYFDDVERHGRGVLPRGRIGERWYSIEPEGSLVADQLDGTVELACHGGPTIIRRGEQVEIRNPEGGKTIGLFDKTHFKKRDCSGPIHVVRNGKRFFITAGGTVLGGKSGFGSAFPFEGRSHTAVEFNGKWGIIDTEGSFTVDPTFAKLLRPFRKNTFRVGDGEDAYLINASGDRVDEPASERLAPAEALTCEGGLRFFKTGDLWGFKDSAGETVVEPVFRALSCFEQGVSWAALPGDRAWCPIGPTGRRSEALDCHETLLPHLPEPPLARKVQ